MKILRQEQFKKRRAEIDSRNSSAIFFARDMLVKAKDEHIRQLTVEAEHLRKHSKSNFWHELSVGTIAFIVGKWWDLVVATLRTMSVEHPVAFWPAAFLCAYGSIVLYAVYCMFRNIYRACRKARKISSVAGYAVQFFSFGLIACAGALPFLLGTFGGFGQSDQKIEFALIVTGGCGVVYNYLRMQMEANRAGISILGLRQISEWAKY